MQAYMAGRGNSNVHVVTHGQTAMTTPSSQDPIPNIVGPSYEISQRVSIDASTVGMHVDLFP